MDHATGCGRSRVAPCIGSLSGGEGTIRKACFTVSVIAHRVVLVQGDLGNLSGSVRQPSPSPVGELGKSARPGADEREAGSSSDLGPTTVAQGSAADHAGFRSDLRSAALRESVESVQRVPRHVLLPAGPGLSEFRQGTGAGLGGGTSAEPMRRPRSA